MIATEADLEHHRAAMTLRQRVNARRALDQAAGTTYPPLSFDRATVIVRTINP